MTFGHPFALIALAALPVLAWLYRRRAGKRTLTVPSLMLWRAALAKAAPESGSRLGRWNWATVCAILFLVAAILAASAPRVRLHSAAPSCVVVVADRSASMATVTSTGETRWTRSVDALATLLDKKRPDRVTLIGIPRTAGPAAETLSADETVKRLRDLAPTDMPMDIGNQIAAVAGYGSDASGFIVLTDNIASIPDTLAGKPVAAVSFGEPSRNTAIDALDVSRAADGKLTILTGIVNYSAASMTIPVNIHAGNAQLASISVQLAPHARTALIRTIPSAPTGTVRVDLDVRDDLAADNHAVATIQTQPLRIGLAGRSNEHVLQALRSLPGVQLIELGAAPDAAPGCDVVIFNGIAPKTLPDADVILIDPPHDIGPLHIAEPLDSPGGLRVLGEPALDVNWSGVLFRRAARIEVQPDAATPLARFDEGGLPLAVQYDDGPRRVVGIASDCMLAATNWPRSPAFPIFWARLVESLARRHAGPIGCYRTGEFIPLPVASAAAPSVIGPDGKPVPVIAAGSQNLFLAEHAGLYKIDATPPEFAAVNMLDPFESANAGETSFDRGRLLRVLAAHGERPQLELWRYFAVAALGFVFAYWGLAARRGR